MRSARVRLKDLPPELREQARALKRAAAEAERMWTLQRFEWAGLPAPTPEYRFDPDRAWRVDWAWPEHRLALEVEGGVWTRGRHTRPSGYLKDLEKYNRLAVLGWRLLRTTPDDLLTEHTAAMVREALS